MIDTGASVSFCSQKVLDNLKTHPHLKHQVTKTYAKKLVVALGEYDGSTAKAEEGVSINLQFATDEPGGTGRGGTAWHDAMHRVVARHVCNSSVAPLMPWCKHMNTPTLLPWVGVSTCKFLTTALPTLGRLADAASP